MRGKGKMQRKERKLNAIGKRYRNKIKALPSGVECGSWLFFGVVDPLPLMLAVFIRI